MSRPIAVFALFLLCLPGFCIGQIKFRVMSYNVENLYDTEDDPEADDEEFLPSGEKKWTQKRYQHKLRQIAKVISAGNDHEPPALAGLCEVENDSVMTNLLRQYPLNKYKLGYCISGRSDRRGIRVALVYREDMFEYIHHKSINVKLQARQHPTRDILHVWGKLPNGDTLDIAMCHFPSKSGGEKKSKIKRLLAAKTLNQLCDSLSLCRKSPLIVAMGDFNDTPDSECLKRSAGKNLRNLFGKSSFGSYKYGGKWEQIDHILVHNSMNSSNSSMSVVPKSAKSLTPPFIIKYGKKGSQRPFRTFQGSKYEGGYSDHLPVIADFIVNIQPKTQKQQNRQAIY